MTQVAVFWMVCLSLAIVGHLSSWHKHAYSIIQLEVAMSKSQCEASLSCTKLRELYNKTVALRHPALTAKPMSTTNSQNDSKKRKLISQKGFAHAILNVSWVANILCINNVWNAIVSLQFGDGLYHPLMVVYYWFTTLYCSLLHCICLVSFKSTKSLIY